MNVKVDKNMRQINETLEASKQWKWPSEKGLESPCVDKTILDAIKYKAPCTILPRGTSL